MPPELDVARVIPRHTDLSERARPRDLPELMDACTDPTVLRGCLHDLSQANRLTGSYRPTLRFLRQILLRHAALSRPLRILDVGFGYGDVLRRIARWARKRRIAVELIGIDLHPLSAQIAAAATAEAGLHESAITWRTGNAIQGTDLEPDVILTSLVMHHLEDEEIVAMLRWMDRAAALGWFINDLDRQPLPPLLWSLLAHLLQWHPFLHHDGPVSFRRAFRTADWQRLLALAGISSGDAIIEPTFPARLCVTRLR